MQKGFEIDLIKRIVDLVPIPVIVCGGCGHPKDIEDLFAQTHVGAVACASIFHYDMFNIQTVKESLISKGLQVSLRSKASYETSHH